ncbi:hypothetical protein V1509DRAFT_643503 [Lipomyces kononenkoae]
MSTILDLLIPSAGSVYDVLAVSEPIEDAAILKHLKSDGVFIVPNALTISVQLFQSNRVSTLFTDSGLLYLQGQSQSLSYIQKLNGSKVNIEAVNKTVNNLPSTANVVFLVSVDEDVFFSNTADEFQHFLATQTLFTSSDKTFIWALNGISQETSNAAGALIQVFKEDDAVDRDGLLLILRIETDPLLDRKLPYDANRKPQLEPLRQERPLALKIGTVGLLDSLHFDDDYEILNSDLADDDIEIELTASAVNFKDIAVSVGIIDD